VKQKGGDSHENYGRRGYVVEKCKQREHAKYVGKKKWNRRDYARNVGKKRWKQSNIS